MDIFGFLQYLLSGFGWTEVIWRRPEFIRFASPVGFSLFLLGAAALLLHQILLRKNRSPSLRRFHKPPRYYTKWIGVIILLPLGILGMLVAAGPEVKTVEQEKQYEEACFGIALDGSLSMLAPVEEGVSETRLQRALRDIEDFVRSLPPSDKLALAVFVKEAKLFKPVWVSEDRERVFFRQLSSITESYVRAFGRSGSNIPAAFKVWTSAFPKDANCQRFVIVLTDGEPQGDKDFLDQALVDAVGEIGKMRPQGAFLVVIGDAREELRIPERDLSGQIVGFETDDTGKRILTRPNLLYLDDVSARFRAKLIFSEHGGELRDRMKEAVKEERKVAGVKLVEKYEHLTRRFMKPFLILFVIFVILILV